MPCRFSCEELQDIDLELNVDNSAFYDQFAIAQVGGVPGKKQGVPALQEAPVHSGELMCRTQACPMCRGQ